MKINYLVLAVYVMFMAGCATQARFQPGGGYQTFEYSNDVSYAEFRSRIQTILTNNWVTLFQRDANYQLLHPGKIKQILAYHMPTDNPHLCSNKQSCN